MLSLATTIGCLLHRLNNGLTLVLLPTQLAPVVAIQAWVSVGSADETPTQAGLSHMMEHMLFKGTGTRGVGEIARDVESAGGVINAWTSRDNTVFHLVMPSRYADIGIEVLSDALCDSSFESLEIEREREVILEEIRQGKDEPLRALAQNMFAGAFEHHPYRKPVIGSEESVARFRRSDLLRFRDRWYRGSNMAVVVAGDFDPREMKQHLEGHFTGLRDGPAPRRRRSRESARARQAARLETAELSESHLALSFRAPPIRDPACAALDLLTVAFGQGESSVLSRELVRRQEVYKTAYSYLHVLQDHSLLVIGAAAEPDKLVDALPALGSELQALRDRVTSSDALAKARHAIEADSIYQRETVEGAARAAGAYMALVGDPEFERDYLRRIASVTSDEMRVAADRYLNPERMGLAALVPDSAALSTAHRRAAAANRMLSLVGRGMRRSAPTASAPGARPAAPAAPKPTSGGVLERTLDNGMKVIIKRDPAVPIVAARAVWSGGTLLESNANSGISQLLAAVITRGCGRRSAEEIIEDVDASAATLSGFSGRNSFGIRAEWLAQDWQRGLDLLSECLLSPRFDREEVERAQRAQRVRLDTQKDSASHRAFRLFQETLFHKHSYRRNALGTVESLRRLTDETLRRHYRRFYNASGLTLAVVGDIEPEKLFARIEARFGEEEPRTRPARKRVTEDFSGRSERSRQVFAYMDREQSQLVLGFPGVTIDDPDRFALEVLTTILGGQGGRLFVELRDRQSLAYQIGAFSLEGLDPGYVVIYLSCSPDKADVASAALRAEIESVLEDGVSAEELARSQRYLIGTHEISLQRRSSVAAAMAFHDAYGLSYDDHRHYPKHIQSVKPADIRRVAQRIFDWQKAVSVTVMPPSASPEAQRRMQGVVKKRKKARRKKAGRKSR